MNRLMRAFLWVPLTIAVLSVLVSIAVMGVGFMYFGFFDASGAFRHDDVSAIASVSSAISTAFALIIGAIAILAVIINERAEIKTVENIKIDISSFWMTLHTLRNRALLYTSPDLINPEQDIFEHERKRLVDFIASPSGFAVYLWQAAADKKLDDVTFDISGLIDLTTLTLAENHRTPVLNSIAHRADQLSRRIALVNDQDFRKMAHHLSKLGAGLNHAKQISSADKISLFLKDWRNNNEGELKMPSESYIAAVLGAARSKIGGKADQTIVHFLNEARNGDAHALKNFYELIRKLGLEPESK